MGRRRSSTATSQPLWLSFLLLSGALSPSQGQVRLVGSGFYLARLVVGDR